MLLYKRNAIRRKIPCAYFRLYREIAAEIQSGTLAPGSRIPSEEELSKRYRISRTSVRSGLAELKKAGMIEKRPGKGSFVRSVFPPAEEEPAYALAVNASFQSPDFWYRVRIADALAGFCAERNCHCVLETRPAGVEKCADAHILLMMPENTDLPLRLAAKGIPSVLFNRISVHEKIAYVAVDYRKESANAVRFLLEKGAERILIPVIRSHCPGPRERGIADGLAKSPEKGVLLDVEGGRNPEYYTEMFRSAVIRKGPDALFLPVGSYAVPALNALQDLGRNDLPVLCFDDVGSLRAVYRRPVWLVRMPLESMVRDAAGYLVERLKNGNTGPVLKRLYQASIVEN